MKKVFIVSAVLFFLAVNFYFAYNFLLKEKDQIETVSEEEKKDKNNSPNLEKLSRLVEKNIKGLSLSEDKGKIQYYNSAEKSFWLSSFDGKSIRKKLSNDDFGDVEKIIWNKNKTEALLKIKDSFYFYRFGDKEKLIKNSRSLNWMNFDQKIVYTYDDQTSGKKTLNIANPDGTSWKEIAVVENDRIIISPIPRSAKSSFWPYSNAFKKSNLTIIPFIEGELESKGELKFGSDYLWSNDGNKFLRSSVSQEGGNNLILEACDLKSDNCINLNLPTLASKCVWTSNDKNIYCAMPTNIARNSVMPNDYFENKLYSNDSFWKVNIESAKKEKALDEKYLKEELDATNLILSPNEDFLFFINRKDGGLFRIIL